MKNNPKWLVVLDAVVEGRRNSGQDEQKLQKGIEVLGNFRARLLGGQALTPPQAKVLMDNIQWYAWQWRKLLDWAGPIFLTPDQIYNAKGRSAASAPGSAELKRVDNGTLTAPLRVENGTLTGLKRDLNGKGCFSANDTNELSSLDMIGRDGITKDMRASSPSAHGQCISSPHSMPSASISTPSALHPASPSSDQMDISLSGGRSIGTTPKAFSQEPTAHPMASPTSSALPLNTGSGRDASHPTQTVISNDGMATANPAVGSSSNIGIGDHAGVESETGPAEADRSDAGKALETPEITQQSYDVRPTLSWAGCQAATASIWLDKKTGRPSGNLDIGTGKYQLNFTTYDKAMDKTMTVDPDGIDKPWRSWISDNIGKHFRAEQMKVSTGNASAARQFATSVVEIKRSGTVARSLVVALWEEEQLAAIVLIADKGMVEIPLKPFRGNTPGSPNLKGTWRA